MVDRSIRFFWAASFGQIYPELRRLEQAGLVVGASEPRGERKRTVYELTPEGERALDEWLREPDAACELRDLGLLKLFFAGRLPHEDSVERVRGLRTDRERILERLREIEAAPGRPRGGFPELVLEFGLGLYEWQVEWCRQTEARLAREGTARAAGGR